MMPTRTVTVELPETLYRQAEETAAAKSLSIEEVLAQSIALSLPPLEDDLPLGLREELSAMMLLSDDALWDIARSELDEAFQSRLEALFATREERPLTSQEEMDLYAVLAKIESHMVKKAESYRLLTRRGFSIPWIN